MHFASPYLSSVIGTASLMACAIVSHQARLAGREQPILARDLRAGLPPIRIIRDFDQPARRISERHARAADPETYEPSGLPTSVARAINSSRSIEIGFASWYGEPFHGRPAASGEIYDMQQLTAAHRTLPFGTLVRVERLDTKESVLVRINDRGPFVDSRIIDLSNAAARRIGLTAPGTIKVSLDVVSIYQDAEPGIFAVQVGAFHEQANANSALMMVKKLYGRATVVLRHREIDLWTVLAGEAHSEDEAAALTALVRSYEPHAFVVRLDQHDYDGQ